MKIGIGSLVKQFFLLQLSLRNKMYVPKAVPSGNFEEIYVP